MSPRYWSPRKRKHPLSFSLSSYPPASFFPRPVVYYYRGTGAFVPARIRTRAITRDVCHSAILCWPGKRLSRLSRGKIMETHLHWSYVKRDTTRTFILASSHYLAIVSLLFLCFSANFDFCLKSYRSTQICLCTYNPTSSSFLPLLPYFSFSCYV